MKSSINEQRIIGTREAVAKGCSVERVFQNSQENTSARAFLNKVAGLKPVALLKKRLWPRCFPVNFAKFLRTPFIVEHLRWLLLGPFLGYQSTWCFIRNAAFSRMNIIFFGDAGDAILRFIYSGQGHLCFFALGGQCRACNTCAYIQKIPYFHAFFDKDHPLSFSAHIIFSEKIKNIFSDITSQSVEILCYFPIFYP